MVEPDRQNENVAKQPSAIKQHALPVSVILMSWFSGIIACGVSCSMAMGPANMLLNHPSTKTRLTAWAWALLAVMFGVYVGRYVGRNVRNRYRKENP